MVAVTGPATIYAIYRGEPDGGGLATATLMSLALTAGFGVALAASAAGRLPTVTLLVDAGSPGTAAALRAARAGGHAEVVRYLEGLGSRIP